MSEKIFIEKSSGNVFADLGFADADELLIKAELVRQICHILRRRRITQARAAKILGIDQPKVSALIRGRLTGFSTDRLLRFLNALDRDIDIVLKTKPRSRKQARIKVVGGARRTFRRSRALSLR